ncbi:hypothetical protein T11_11169 [Trichinella zimbabwensis]|uniref:Uncharacterized protein n=1 Tax=Trichinella zimbabwensis TaxID=268475 RepID=A0A0V1G940_9BILA|nr:hypothetical protein T11_11169 [Trichinella zimbabwensis]
MAVSPRIISAIVFIGFSKVLAYKLLGMIKNL